MLTIPLLKSKSIISLILLYSILIIATILCEAPFMLMLTLMLWLLFMIYTIIDIKNHIGTFCFLISFFVFLLGREVCFSYLGVEVYYLYLASENDFAFTCLIISMVGLGVAKLISSKKNHDTVYDYTTIYANSIKKISKWTFYFCYFFQLLATLIQIVFVRKVGYIASYAENTGGNGIPAIVSYVGAFMPIALNIFLASKPSKKDTMGPLALYEIYAILTIFTGRRYPFVAINMLILIYLTLRNREEKGWISKRLIYAVVAFMPVLIVFLSAYDSIRTGVAFSFNGLINTFIDFFDNQGGSINVIKRVRYYSEDLRDLNFCSLDSTRTLMFENLIVRKLFNINIYSGNSIEHARLGHSLAHRLSYYTYGNGYLMGRGGGSCYIAELYHDFGFVGIILGSFIYGRILYKIDHLVFSHPFKDGIILSIVYYILLAPRGEFDGFVGNVFGIYSLAGFAFIFIIAKVISRRCYQYFAVYNKK